MKVKRPKLKEPNFEDPFIRAMEVRKMLGGESIVRRCEREMWFAPVVRRKRMTLYKRSDIEAALVRIQAGELP
jgi:hypothetical protein